MRSIVIHIITYLTIILFPFPAYSHPQYVFRHLDIVDGMSDNQIRNLVMLPDNRLSIQTASILNIYNGAGFDHFYYDKKKEYKWVYNRLPNQYCDSKNRLWIKEMGYLLLLDLNTNQFNYEIETELRSMGITSPIKDLYMDKDQNIWFVEEDNTASYFDEKAQELIIVSKGNSKFTEQYGVPREITQYKNLCWIVYTSGLITCWDYSSREFVSQDSRFLDVINDKTDRLYIHPTQNGDLWLMYNQAVSFFNRTERIWTEIATISGRSNFFTCMDLDLDENVWVGTSASGLRLINNQTFEVTVMSGMKLNTGETLTNDIFSVYVDENNGVWVGTLFQGLCYYQPSMNKFKLIQILSGGSMLTSENVRCFFEEDDGNIIIGSANGLFLFNPKTLEIRQIFHELANELCLSIHRDNKNRLWVSTFLGGFYCIDGNNVRNYKWNKTIDESNPVYNTGRYLYQDKNNRFWVSIGREGVGEFFPQTGEIKLLSESHPEIAFHKVDYEIQPVNDHTFYVIGESGIYFYDTLNDQVWIPEINDPDNPRFQGINTRYYCLFRDSRSLEWQATDVGVNIWDENNDKFYNLTVKQGLPSNTISAVIEDEVGMIWLSTANGLSKIEVREETDGYIFSIVNFGHSDGLQVGKFYNLSALKASDGTIYFGGVHGFNFFNPQQIQYNKSVYAPIFTSFSLFNSVIKEGEKYNDRIILEKPINRIQEIKLKYNENFISLEFAGLNYVNPSQTYFRYKLENFDRQWTEIVTNGQGQITYTGLRPGNYKLIVYTANNDKLWNENPAELSISISPPFWATTCAYVTYLALFLIIIWFTVHFLKKKNRRKIAELQLVNERKQKEELDQMKFRFFTNISHEFRTPLTLIITPLDILIKEESNLKVKNKLLSVRKNARDLLTLVNQLLDFRKLEMQGEKLLLSKNDIVEFIENIYRQFKDTIVSKNINFTFENKVDSQIIYFDKNKIQKVANNLISNALKFTPDGGNISLHINMLTENGRQYVNISVEDTGCGIAEEDLNNIFDRFYQSTREDGSEPGSSGIGLHLAKEYIDMHQGKITVNSRVGKGSIFNVLIPTDLEGKDNLTEQKPFEESIPDDETSKTTSTKTILVVEDNNEFRNFLVEQLSKEFNVIEATDGEEGEKMVQEHSPDLIVSDLMMPKVDGLTFCKNLKAQIETSHIPFILLTARNSDESKIEGYEAGADSYISKPFNFDILLIRIRKLIEQQEKRQELFHKTIEVTPSSITVNSLDEEFIRKALVCVEKNIDNTEYSVENLSSDIGLHRSHLYRKLQSITGQTPIDFMRTIRLKRAAQLLISSQYNVSEIADRVGFNTIKYFNKYFKEEFGMTPTQYRSKNKEV